MERVWVVVATDDKRNIERVIGVTQHRPYRLSDLDAPGPDGLGENDILYAVQAPVGVLLAPMVLAEAETIAAEPVMVEGACIRIA